MKTWNQAQPGWRHAALFTLMTSLGTTAHASSDGPLLWYPFDDPAGSGVITDASGNGHDGTVSGGVTLDGDVAYLDGSSGYIRLPDNILANVTAITVMTKVYIDSDQPKPYFIYGLGNINGAYGNGYLFTTGNYYRTSISSCHWSCEQNVATPTDDIDRDGWHHLAYTLDGGTAVLYLDGAEVARTTGISMTPADIGNGITSANFLGRSLYSADAYLHGAVDDFQIWDRALDASDIAAAAGEVMPELTANGGVAADAAWLEIANIDNVRGHLYLPTSGKYGSTIYWYTGNPGVIDTSGIVTRPQAGQSAKKVRLTARIQQGVNTRVKTFMATVQPLPQPSPLAGYFFTYFTGEGYANGEQIYAALSNGNDPLDWQTLNDEAPILTSTLGESGARDPFIIRSPDGDRFFLIATDLKIYGNGDWSRAVTNGSQSLLVWESDDLIHWSEPRLVKVSPDTAGNTWAPEAFWDPERQAYIVFWASEIYSTTNRNNSTYHKMMYAMTRDFIHFSDAEVWVDKGYSTIDSTLIQHGDQYYRFTKDERSASESACGKFILSETATSLADLDWAFQTECIGSGSIARGEGPLIFKSNTEDKWYLFIDEFGGRGYIPFESTDLDGGIWTVPASYNLPGRPRHGTVLPITADEYNAILNHWGTP